jgi:hypothetical protein
MSYWGSGPTGCDYAFGGVSVYVGLISDRLFVDMEGTLVDEYKEQRIIAGLKMIRVLAKEFPKEVSIGFTRQDYKRAKDGFEKWYELCEKKVPKKYRDDFIKEAREELQLFESEVLGSKT